MEILVEHENFSLSFNNNKDFEIEMDVEDLVIPPTSSKLSAILLTESCLIILINLLAIIIIFRRKRIYHMTCNIFLTALLFSHIWIAVIGLIMFSMEYITLESSFNKNSMFEKIILKLYLSSFTSSFGMVTIVTFDRLFAIKFPFFYNKIAGRCKYPCISITIAVVLPLGLLALSLVRNFNSAYPFFVSSATATSIFLVIVNLMCYHQSRNQVLSISKTVVDENKDTQKNLRKYCLRNHKAMRTCLLIVLSFIILWLPMGVTVTLRIAIGPSFRSKLTDKLRYIVAILKYANSLVDPVIYILVNRKLMREFRRTSKFFLGACSSSNTQDHTYSSIML